MRGRLWRAANPNLPDIERRKLVDRLMAARRAVAAARRSGDGEAEKQARQEVHAAKLGLGERVLVWWDDGAPDFDRHLLKNTPYAQE